jgi:Tetratricopeptide repeat
MRDAAFSLAVLISAATAGAATPDEAARLFDARRWAEAAEAYRSQVDASPANAGAWLRLASAQAAGGNAEAAFETLKGWAATGTLIYQAVMASPELEPLRADARFAALVEPLRPCAAPEHRQFDFWIGEWDVTSPQYPGTTSRSRIARINDGCTIREEYTTPVAYAGTSLNFFDARSRRWHQTWSDNQGGVLHLEGVLEDGAMVLSMPAGAEATQRITWTPLDDGRVRQHWEVTADGGKTWSTVFDGYYTRRPAP